MADVFISYSRHNSPFARRLIEQLTLKGKDAWVDWEGIPLTAPNWWSEIKAGIEGADSFVFIMSPDSMASVVCNMELDYAIELRKRIIPVMYQEIESRDAFASIADFESDDAMQERLAGKDALIIARDNWQRLSHINWVFFRDEDDFDTAFEKLITTAETDLQYVKAHTRYLTRAQEWQRENRRSDLLLFGEEIEHAEAWLVQADQFALEAEQPTQDKIKVVNPLPQVIQRDYIALSRQAHRRRRRLARSAQGSIVLLLAVLIAGVIIASRIVSDTQQEVDNIQGTSDRNVADANTQVGIAGNQIATATRALVTATHVAQLEAEGQATLGSVNTQAVDAIMTVTSAAIDQDITARFANTILQQRNNPVAQLFVMDELVARYPENALVYLVRGLIYDIQGNHESAITEYDRAIEMDPGRGDFYYNRGSAYYDLGNYENAITDFDRAIELEAQVVVAYTNRGNAHSELGNYEQALADFDRATELDPQLAVPYNNRGSIYSDTGNYEAAIAEFDKAIELDPQYADAYNNRGYVYAVQGNLEAAIADFDEVIALDPLFADAYYNRGTAYGHQGDYEAALPDLDRAIELDPMNIEAYNNRGLVYFDQGNFEDAISDFDRVIELDSQSVFAYEFRGDARYELGQLEAAISDYREYEQITGQLEPYMAERIQGASSATGDS